MRIQEKVMDFRIIIQRLALNLTYLPYTYRVNSSLLVPRWLLASQRYVPLSVLFSVVMMRSRPSTIIRSISGSSPPSFVQNTGSGLKMKFGLSKFIKVPTPSNTSSDLAFYSVRTLHLVEKMMTDFIFGVNCLFKLALVFVWAIGLCSATRRQTR